MADDSPSGAYRAVVTGASPGSIGAVVASRLIETAHGQGLEPRITITATKPTGELEASADSQRDRGAKVLVLTGDLRTTTFPVEVAEKAIEFAGGLDTLVSNAGNTRLGRLVDQTTLEEWDSVMNVHARAAW